MTNRSDRFITRGALATKADCSIETIRYYEQIGLLPPPPRTEGGHRLYGQEMLKRLNFIRRSRELGFTLEDIRGLLRMVDGHKYTCAQVEALALDHVHSIQRKISDLKKLKNVLATMASKCRGGKVPECPVIDALFGARI
jgi:MerR family mercuric resistance operon transcriptional regulator